MRCLLLLVVSCALLPARTWVVVGKVMLEDGPVPPGTVYIERVCSGYLKRETTAGSKGDFSFSMDGEVTPLRGTAGSVLSCTVRAALEGYTSSVASIAAVLDANTQDPYLNVGVLLLRRISRPAAPSVSLDALKAPARSRNAHEKGLSEFRKSRWAAARKEFEKAVTAYAAHEEAWYYLGLTHEKEGNFRAARGAYERSLAANPAFGDPYPRLAELAAREGNWRGVSEIAARGIRLDALRFPVLHVLAAFASYNLGDLDAAEAAAREAIRLDAGREHPKAQHILGSILLRKGKPCEAAGHLREYLRLAPAAGDAETVTGQLREARAAGCP